MPRTEEHWRGGDDSHTHRHVDMYMPCSHMHLSLSLSLTHTHTHRHTHMHTSLTFGTDSPQQTGHSEGQDWGPVSPCRGPSGGDVASPDRQASRFAE